MVVIVPARGCRYDELFPSCIARREIRSMMAPPLTPFKRAPAAVDLDVRRHRETAAGEATIDCLAELVDAAVCDQVFWIRGCRGCSCPTRCQPRSRGSRRRSVAALPSTMMRPFTVNVRPAAPSTSPPPSNPLAVTSGAQDDVAAGGDVHGAAGAALGAALHRDDAVDADVALDGSESEEVDVAGIEREVHRPSRRSWWPHRRGSPCRVPPIVMLPRARMSSVPPSPANMSAPALPRSRRERRVMTRVAADRGTPSSSAPLFRSIEPPEPPPTVLSQMRLPLIVILSPAAAVNSPPPPPPPPRSTGSLTVMSNAADRSTMPPVP